MLSIVNCSQYHPYAGKIDPCGGNVHRLRIKHDDGSVEPMDIVVCDSHMESFGELGQRPRFRLTIMKNEIIGVITPTSSEGQRPLQERK